MAGPTRAFGLRYLIGKHAEALPREFFRGAAGSLVLKGSSAPLALIGSVVLARILGPEEYGVYAYAMALAHLLTLPGMLGMPVLAVREVAAYHSEERWDTMLGFLRWSTGSVLLASGAVAAIGALLLPLLPAAAGRPVVLWAALATVPMVCLGNLGESVIRGLRRVLLGQLAGGLLRPLVFLLAIGGLLLAGDRMSPLGAAGAQVVAAGVGLGVVWLLVRRLRPPQLRGARPVREGRRWIFAALPMGLVGAMGVITHRIDLVVLGILADASQTGIYRVALGGGELIAIALGAANAVLQPMFAALHARGDRDGLQRVVTLGARVVLALSLPMAAGLVFFARPILGFVFGAEYAPAASALTILVVGQLVNAAVGSVGFLLMMTGHERDTAVIVALGALLNLVLDVVLIPLFGVEGAAAATAISLAAWNLALAIRVLRVLRIRPTAFVSVRRTGP